jgi:hypothetical protein
MNKFNSILLPALLVLTTSIIAMEEQSVDEQTAIWNSLSEEEKRQNIEIEATMTNQNAQHVGQRTLDAFLIECKNLGRMAEGNHIPIISNGEIILQKDSRYNSVIRLLKQIKIVQNGSGSATDISDLTSEARLKAVAEIPPCKTCNKPWYKRYAPHIILGGSALFAAGSLLTLSLLKLIHKL